MWIKRSSYSIAGQVVAIRVTGDPANSGLFYVLSDHLGSTSLLVNSSGGTVTGSTMRYLPYGGYRGTAPTQTITDRDFTGQKENMELGLLYYQARFYVPGIARFASADTIVPNPASPQSFNRYAYTLNNPIRYTDPTGHVCYDPSLDAAIPGNCNGGSTPLPQTPISNTPQNPWQPADQSKNGHDNMSAEEILFESFVMPANSNFNGFGGPMTSIRCGPDFPGRPPCDARHPSVDSSTGLNNEGDPIYAVAYGRVVRAGIPPDDAFDGQGTAGGFGHYVIIEHNIYGSLLYSVYAHNGTVLVEAGDIVGAGDQIATMGNSGTAVVHLHFEIRQANNIDWEADNPFQSQMYWPASVTELTTNFVDLGPVFGYNDSYADWAASHP